MKDGTEHKALPPASPAQCAHEHVKFADGTFLMVCIDCDQKWAAISGAGAFDYKLKATPMYPPRDTRHDRWVMARTEKIQPIAVTHLKKPVR